MAKSLVDYPNISLKPENISGFLDFKAIFGRSAHIHIEVGSGKGTFLTNETKVHPNNDYIGIEWANKYYRFAVDRLGRWKIPNVRMIRTDAAVFIAMHVPDSSVEAFHIYFPDPWPKLKQTKKRFISAVNLEKMHRCLKKGGIIRIATDHCDYFKQMEVIIDSFSEKFKRIDFFKAAGASENEWVGTNFERKYIKEKRQIYTVAVKKL
jgi:tRNA (guanine-N7-)-methyltransferase